MIKAIENWLRGIIRDELQRHNAEDRELWASVSQETPGERTYVDGTTVKTTDGREGLLMKPASQNV